MEQVVKPINVVEQPDTAQIIKDAALKAAVGAIVGVAVTQLAGYLVKKAVTRHNNKKEAKLKAIKPKKDK